MVLYPTESNELNPNRILSFVHQPFTQYYSRNTVQMLCAGSIRAKNVKNVILWNLLDSCGGGLAFWAVGYAFAYGGEDDTDKKTFVGNQGFFLKNDGDIRLENWFFQFAFACALSSIVAGTIAERTQMKAYLLYSVFLVGFVYPVCAHAFWSTNGFLSAAAADPFLGSGVIDLAGSGAVHSKWQMQCNATDLHTYNTVALFRVCSLLLPFDHQHF